MIVVQFTSADGVVDKELDEGQSLMEAAVRAGIDGIDADCGGALSCATCHVYVDPAWIDTLAPPTEDERAMLEYAVDPDERSRLSCQIALTTALNGLKVTVPDRQQ